MSEATTKIIEMVEKMTVLELAELVKELEENSVFQHKHR